MMYDYQGVVEEVGQTQTVGSNGFTKRDIIVGNDIDSEARYPNPVKFTFKRMNTSLLDPIQKGQRVKVRFAIDGRRWDGGPRGTQYFVDLTGIKIDQIDDAGNVISATPASAAVPAPAAPAAGAPAEGTSEFVDDVPF